MRQGKVYYHDFFAGVVSESEEGEYSFEYDSRYIEEHPDLFLSFTMPVRQEPYIDKQLFPFFEGLIPEGWLLDIVVRSWKIKQNDRMGLLLACCANCIGAVSVLPYSDGEDGLG